MGGSRHKPDVEDEARFRALFEQAYPALRRYAHHRGLAAADAEDLVAATLEIAWRRLGEVPVEEPLPWLYVVAHNLWRGQRRKDLRRGEIMARLGPRPGTGPDPGELYHDRVLAALESLSEDDQEILRLVAWDDLSSAELAAALGCSAVTARSRLHRARNRLADRLGLDQRRPPLRDRGAQFDLGGRISRDYA